MPVSPSGTRDLVIALLAAARADWEPYALHPPRVSDDDWSGLAASLFRQREEELAAAARQAVGALDEAIRAVVSSHG